MEQSRAECPAFALYRHVCRRHQHFVTNNALISPKFVALLVDITSPRIPKNVATIARHSFRQGLHVFERVELQLIRKANRRAVEYRIALEKIRIKAHLFRQSSITLKGFGFLISVFVQGRKKKTRDMPKPTFDL